MRRRSGILGGTFNPVHVAHLRLALEAAQQLHLDRVVLMPAHIPAHKGKEGLLPFALRAELLRAAVHDSPRLEVSMLEAELPAPYYTWNSLEAWKQRNPDDTPLFIVGVEDFSCLDTWHRGLELPRLVDFVVVARGGTGQAGFVHTLRRLWSQAVINEQDEQDEQGTVAEFPCGRTCTFINMPPLDISASLVRTKWLRGHDIRFLIPDPALEVLRAHEQTVTQCWRDGSNGSESPCP